MAQKKKNIAYQKALEELEKILNELQTETVDIDQLSKKLNKAYELIEICRSKISSAEAEVKKINEQFSQK